jgi:microcystin-dependent protein
MDISASNWNEADASNSAAAPDGAPEGMAPSGVNDVLRAHQGAIKRWYDWTIPKVTAGTSTAYTLAYTVAPGALVDGMTHLVEFHTTNGAAATLNVNALGAIPLYYYSGGLWRAVPPGLFEGTEVVRVAYHASSGAYRIMNPGAEKTGTVKAFAGSTVPGGYLLCFGQAVSRTAYAGLFNVVGTAYGAGDGSTTFNVPDLRGRVAAGKDDMGGSAANRITGTTVPNSPQLGAAGGAQTNTATTTVSGSATGTLTGTADVNTAGEVAAAVSGAGAAGVAHSHPVSVSGSLAVSASGTSGAFSVVQPTIILNQMIRI